MKSFSRFVSVFFSFSLLLAGSARAVAGTQVANTPVNVRVSIGDREPGTSVAGPDTWLTLQWESMDTFAQLCGMAVDSYFVRTPAFRADQADVVQMQTGLVEIQTSRKSGACLSTVGKEYGDLSFRVGRKSPDLSSPGFYDVVVNGRYRGSFFVDIVRNASQGTVRSPGFRFSTTAPVLPIRFAPTDLYRYAQ